MRDERTWGGLGDGLGDGRIRVRPLYFYIYTPYSSINLYYESLDEVHAPSRVVADGQTRDLIYEDNGNLVIGYDFSRKDQLPERRLTYNAENMPLTIEYQPQGGSTATTQITYDGDGRRVKKQTGADSVIYVDETYEIRNDQPVKYVFAGDQRVARIRGSEVHYFHKDHLGSSTLVTDAAGGLLESTTYEPYGLQRPDCDPKLGNVPYTFTDQEWDSETGLYNYDARLYDPVLGRFLSADSVIPNWHDPQALNRYAYARNNPLKYVDPDGHSFFSYLRKGNFADPFSDPTPIVSNGMYRDRRTNQWLGEKAALESPLIQPEDVITFGAAALGKAIVAKTGAKVAASLERKIATEAVEEGFSKSSTKLLPQFDKSLIDSVSSSAASARGQTTEGARAIAKKLGHAQAGGYESAFKGATPTQESADKLIRGILSNPNSSTYGNKTIDVYNSLGQGVRFDRTNNRFVGFIEKSLSKR